MSLRKIYLLLASVGFSLFALVLYFENLVHNPQPTIDEEDAYNLDGWKPALTPKGATDWRVLMAVTVSEVPKGDDTDYIPTYTPEIKALNHQRIKLNGYMIPLQTDDEQTHFVLMAYPHSCPFHMPGGPGAYVEVKTDFPVTFTYDTVLIEGYFQVHDSPQNGVLYSLTAGQHIK